LQTASSIVIVSQNIDVVIC